jgi:hypothetical protein
MLKYSYNDYFILIIHEIKFSKMIRLNDCCKIHYFQITSQNEDASIHQNQPHSIFLYWI